MVINDTGGTCSRVAMIYIPNVLCSIRKCSYCTGFVIVTNITNITLQRKRHPQHLQTLTMILFVDSVRVRSTKDQVRAALLSTGHLKRVMTQDWWNFPFSLDSVCLGSFLCIDFLMLHMIFDSESSKSTTIQPVLVPSSDWVLGAPHLFLVLHVLPVSSLCSYCRLHL